MEWLILLPALVTLLTPAQGHKILCIFTVPSHSHNTLAKGIVDPLLNAGHQVTWASPYPEKVKSPPSNLRVVDVSGTRPLTENINMTEKRNDFNFVLNFARNISRVTVETPALREVLVKEQFDAVITEWFFSDTDAGYAALQGVPWILLSGMALHPQAANLVDDVRSVTIAPMMMTTFNQPMTLWERAGNVAMYCAMAFSTYWKDWSATETRYKELYTPLALARGVTLPPFKDAMHNVSILLVNSHPSVAPAVSVPPNVIDIAGYHISKDTTPLPKDIQDILDSSKQGVVYFSMGSVLKSSILPESTRRDLIKILGEIPYTVLWKFEEKLEGLPKNIHVRPWWPQSQILAHPNIKLFITHGGLLSTLEAVQNGVPLLGIPVFGDQPSNARAAERSGYGRVVPYATDMGDKLRVALNDMLKNDRYYKRAKFLSKIFNNRPVAPSKLITHYVELAIETKGAYHLRSPVFLYAWYERWMLDVIGLIVLIISIIVIVVKRLLSRIFKTKVIKKVKKN